MANPLVRTLRRLSLRLSLIKSPLSFNNHILGNTEPNFIPPTHSLQISWLNNQLPLWLWRRSFSHGSVSLVISPQGKPKFEIHETDPPKKDKWLTKKRLKLQRMREKKKRKAANKRDPRRLTVKGKKQRFATAEERIKYKIGNARIKEALLIERLKKYEVPKAQGPIVEPHVLTGEERFYMKKMAQKKSNYVPVGRRGIFGGVILNMHLHWKKHETVKVICKCKPCKAGQVQEYANEIARLSGGIPIQIIGDDTIIFYRGKNYVQPEIMSPVDTLSKKRALEKSKYEQSLESVQHFIAVAEKELELYYRHVALYADPNDKDHKSIPYNSKNKIGMANKTTSATMGRSSESCSEEEAGDTDEWISEIEGNYEHENELDSEDDFYSENLVSSDESVEDDMFRVQDGFCDVEEGIVTRKS